METTFEVCVDDVNGTQAAERAGASRVELCSALFEGGLTPSAGLVETALRAASTIRVHVMIRPRGGDFIYDEHELEAMLHDIALARRLGAHGVVIGALTPDGDVDVPRCRRLLEAAGDMSVTFHRAFDMARDPKAALESLVSLGIPRVLSSGQEDTALEGAPLLSELVALAADRIVVMPGGGITERNITRVLAQTHATEVHFGAATSIAGPARFRNPRPAMGGTLRQSEYDRRVTTQERVSGFLQEVSDHA